MLLSGQTGEYTEAEADLVIMAEADKLPKPGRLGIGSYEDDRGVIIKRTDSRLQQGFRRLSVDDRIRSIAGQRIRSIEDIR